MAFAPPEALSCPSCAGSVAVRPELGTRAVACTYCGSVLGLSAGQLGVLGQMDPKVGPGQPIAAGDEAVFFDEPHLVTGWLRYEGWDSESRWRWDEWQLVSDSGVPRYLSHSDDEGWTLQTPVRPTPPIEGRKIFLRGKPAFITERSPATITALRGELTWVPRLGETLRTIEARRGKERYSAELTADEVEVVGGPRLSEREVWAAFGRDDLLAEAEARVEARRRRRSGYRAMALVSLVAAGLFVLAGHWAERQEREVLRGVTSYVATPPDSIPSAGADTLVQVYTSVPVGTISIAEVPDDRYSVRVALSDAPLGRRDTTDRVYGSVTTPVLFARLYVEEPDGDLHHLNVGSRAYDFEARSRTDSAAVYTTTGSFMPVQAGAHTVRVMVSHTAPPRLEITATATTGWRRAEPYQIAGMVAALLGVVLFLAGGMRRIDP